LGSLRGTHQAQGTSRITRTDNLKHLSKEGLEQSLARVCPFALLDADGCGIDKGAHVGVEPNVHEVERWLGSAKLEVLGDPHSPSSVRSHLMLGTITKCKQVPGLHQVTGWDPPPQRCWAACRVVPRR
jgi:hypothetical protein